MTNRLAGLGRSIDTSLTLARFEGRKLRRDPTELFTRAVQPVLWLLLFGQVLARNRSIPTEGQTSYLDFLAPGILAQSVLFVAIFYGIAVIWERDLGLLPKYLATPTPRATLVLGKAMSAAVRSFSQVVIIYLLCALLRVHLSWNPLRLAGVLLFVFTGAALFASLSMVAAVLVKTRERFLGIGQVLTLPLFFVSNAIYPVAAMPHWMQVAARVNPLTYEVDALRGLMLGGGSTLHPLWFDYAVLLVVLAFLVALGARLYPRIVNA